MDNILKRPKDSVLCPRVYRTKSSNIDTVISIVFSRAAAITISRKQSTGVRKREHYNPTNDPPADHRIYHTFIDDIG